MIPWYIFAIATAFLAAGASIVEKRTLNFKDESPLQFSTLFAFINASFSLFLIPFINLQFPIRIYIIIFIAALIGSTTGFLLIAKALNQSTISKISPLLNISPLFVLTLAFIFLGENINRFQTIGIVLTVIGAYILESENLRNILTPLKRLFRENASRLMIIAAFIYSISSILTKYVLNFVDPITLLVVVQVFVSFNFFGIMLYKSKGGINKRIEEVISKASHNWHWIFLAAFLTTSYRLLQLQAMNVAFVSLVVPIKRTSTLISTVAGGEFFGDDHIIRKTSSCIIMIIGATLIITM